MEGCEPGVNISHADYEKMLDESPVPMDVDSGALAASAASASTDPWAGMAEAVRRQVMEEYKRRRR